MPNFIELTEAADAARGLKGNAIVVSLSAIAYFGEGPLGGARITLKDGVELDVVETMEYLYETFRLYGQAI